MTIDERIERLEHVTAAHIDQAKKDYEENRRLWQEQREECAAIWKATDLRFAETDQLIRELAEQQAEGGARTRQEIAERDRVMDRRIGDLVSAIADLIRRMDQRPSEAKPSQGNEDA